MSVKYEYEPEGFDLGDGVLYLPDFYLPREQLYFEIKPEADLAQPDLKKITLFADKLIGTSKNFLVAFGSPWFKPNILQFETDVCIYGFVYLVQCPHCPDTEPFHLATLRGDNDGTVSEEVYAEIIRRMSKTPRLMDAYTAARQARFEHGEKPVVRMDYDDIPF